MNAATGCTDLLPLLDMLDQDADAAAQAIVERFNYFCELADPVSSTFASVARAMQLATSDPLYIAAMEVAGTIDGGVGVRRAEDYHSARHCCEVLLCALCLSRLAHLNRREQAQVAVAALLHDFHHDGRPNGAQTFRLELQSVREGQRYLQSAGVPPQEQQCLTVLILATEISQGVPYARACYAKHFLQETEADRQLSAHAPTLALLPLRENPRVTLQALVLAEADVLPSVGLTVEHADVAGSRLAREWSRPLGPEDKLVFIDQVIGDFVVARFFSPNLRRVRQVNVERAANSG